MIPPKRSGRHVLDAATGQAIPLAEWQKRQAAPEPTAPSLPEPAPTAPTAPPARAVPPKPEPDKSDKQKPKPAEPAKESP